MVILLNVSTKTLLQPWNDGNSVCHNQGVRPTTVNDLSYAQLFSHKPTTSRLEVRALKAVARSIIIP
jgi:hypothetical protein